MINKKFWITCLSAWIVFIGIDFLFHASLLEGLWKEEIQAFRSATDLFILIPAGYLSFLLLTLLVGWLYDKLYKASASIKDAMEFALIFGTLFSLANLLGVYSFVEIPFIYLMRNMRPCIYFLQVATLDNKANDRKIPYYFFCSSNCRYYCAEPNLNHLGSPAVPSDLVLWIDPAYFH